MLIEMVREQSVLPKLRTPSRIMQVGFEIDDSK